MKLFKKKPPPPTLTREQALGCVPEISPSVDWWKQESGVIMVEYPFAVNPLLQAIFARFNPNQPEQRMTKKLELDQLGTQVWEQLDGEKTVRDIIRDFARVSTVSTQEAEQSVTAFIRELGRRGLIVLR